MKNKLSLNIDGASCDIDEFFKSVMFQYIMDNESMDRDERDILLFIFRKTLHFNKWSDRLGIYFISKSTGIGQVKTRKVIKQLEEKHFITVTRSKGGRIDSDERFHLFMIHNDVMFTIFQIWVAIKESNGFDVWKDN